MARASSLVRVAGYQSVLSGLEDLLDVAGDDVWVVGTNTEYAVWLEEGTRQMPPYPWLRPAVRDVMSNKADDLAEEASDTDELVAAIALEIESQAKANVSAGRASNRSRGTHPDHPRRQSSNLVNSIEAVRL